MMVCFFVNTSVFIVEKDSIIKSGGYRRSFFVWPLLLGTKLGVPPKEFSKISQHRARKSKKIQTLSVSCLVVRDAQKSAGQFDPPPLCVIGLGIFQWK